MNETMLPAAPIVPAKYCIKLISVAMLVKTLPADTLFQAVEKASANLGAWYPWVPLNKLVKIDRVLLEDLALTVLQERTTTPEAPRDPFLPELSGVVIVAGDLAEDAETWLRIRGARIERMATLVFLELPRGAVSERGVTEGTYALTFPQECAEGMDPDEYVLVHVALDARETRVRLWKRRQHRDSPEEHEAYQRAVSAFCRYHSFSAGDLSAENHRYIREHVLPVFLKAGDPSGVEWP